MNPRILCMGKPMSGKSTLASSLATVEHPIDVFHFDSFGKDLPYLDLGQPVKLDDSSVVILNEKGEPLARVTYFHEPEPEEPSAWEAFRAHLASSKHLEPIGEVKPAAWVLDSATMLELACRGYSRFKMNKGTKEPRQHWGFATDCLEQLLLQRFGCLPGMVLVLCHIDSDKDERDGAYIYNPALPGRLRDKASSGYTEVWRCFTSRDKAGKVSYKVQTQPCDRYGCASNLGIPDGLPNDAARLLGHSQRKVNL